MTWPMGSRRIALRTHIPLQMQTSMIFISSRTRPSLLRNWIFVAALAVVQGTAFAQDDAVDIDATADIVAKQFPAGSILDKDIAAQALDMVKQARSEITIAADTRDRECYTRFFVTRCLDKVKESKRLALGELRSVEVEANAFLRRERVVERDRQLEKDRLERESKTPQAERPVRMPQSVDPQQQEREQAQRKLNEEEYARRAAEHEARQERLRAKEAAGAAKRERNALARERKVQQSLERQRELEERAAKDAATKAAK